MSDYTPRGPIDDEGQVTPHGDALSESESVSSNADAGTTAASIAAALRAAGVARTSDERGFTRDKVDVDIGQDESLRAQLARRFAISTDLDAVLASVQATRAQNATLQDNYQDQVNRFWSGLSKANGVFNNALAQDEALETANEVITTATLAQMVMALADEVTALQL
jgi:hypothetical protein